MATNWNTELTKVMKSSGFQRWVKDFVSTHGEDLENIETHVEDMVLKLISGDPAGSMATYQRITRPSAKLIKARELIATARADQKKFKEFQNSVSTILSFIIKTAVKSAL